ncbi:hypothetical protein BGX24_005761, partial [Mortierella sp. AD032]
YIGDDGAKALAEALKTNSTLTTLNFGENKIDSDGAHALTEALKTNSTVAIVNIGNTKAERGFEIFIDFKRDYEYLEDKGLGH